MQTTNNLSATVVSIGARGCKHIVVSMFQLLMMCQHLWRGQRHGAVGGVVGADDQGGRWLRLGGVSFLEVGGLNKTRRL